METANSIDETKLSSFKTCMNKQKNLFIVPKCYCFKQEQKRITKPAATYKGYSYGKISQELQ